MLQNINKNKSHSIKHKIVFFAIFIGLVTMLFSYFLSATANYIAMQIDAKRGFHDTSQFIENGLKQIHNNNSQEQELNTFFQSLHLDSYLDKACYYYKNKALIASYTHQYLDGHRITPCPKIFDLRALKQTDDMFHISEIITITDSESQLLGSFYIQYDLDKNFVFFVRELVIQLLCIGIALFAVYFMAIRFHTFIARPIYHLSGLAASLAESHDYSLRAKKFSDDELGTLSDAFNEMIIGMGKYSDELEKARDEADHANAQKSSFLAMMSHEIRTPINGVIGTVDLLAETRLTGRQREYVEIIEKSAVTLFELINDILDFSKIEADKLELEKRPFDLTAKTQDIIDICEIHTSQKNLQLFFNNNLEQNYHVMGDSVRMKQIIMNLLGNAIKFTEKGSITLTLAEDPSPPQDTDETIKQIWISVTDTGIGIPEDRQQKIFDSFTQADGATTREYGGSGLGLSICKKLVELMDGTIGIKSTTNVGSTFWFSIPMPVIEKKDIESKQQDKKLLTPQTQDNRILLVEDNETNVMITSEILSQAGYEVTHACDGAEAITCYCNNPFALILMDCQMPIMDGWESTQRIRAFEKETSLEPSIIVALTANAMAGDREKCIEAGMDDYLAKPFKKKELLEKLAAVTNKSDT